MPEGWKNSHGFFFVYMCRWWKNCDEYCELEADFPPSKLLYIYNTIAEELMCLFMRKIDGN